MTEAGDLVELRGEEWIVANTERFEACTILTLDGRGRHNGGRRWRAVEPFDRPVIHRPRPPWRRRRSCVLRAALRAIAGARPPCSIWTATRARMNLLAYQLEPALAVLNGATRVLLADEVGLGKTVQAGLILCELRARGLADHALILTPAGLRDMWAAELRDRFDLRPVVLDQAALAAALPGLPAGINPWSAHDIVIASIDLVKRPEILAAVEQVAFDLVIADEAHHLTPGSDRGAAIEHLAARSVWVVLASATPHSGDEEAFGYLMRLGEMGDRMAVFRRTRRDVGHGAGRRAHLLPVAPTAAESRMLQAAEWYAKAIWHGRGQHDRGARLLSIILARRAASSATALERTLTRRLHLLAGRAISVAPQPSLPWDDTDESDGNAADELLGLPGLDDGAHETRVIEGLIASAREAQPHASKIRRIDRLLRLAREPAVVFTEYRDTLDALVKALGPGRAVAALHGGLSASERVHCIDAFNGGAVDLLIATDAAGEGLNLQHRCRLVIDVELPWNPLRLEQRFGRIDRIGQTRRAHAVRLVHRGTIEDAVLARLEQRRRRASLALEVEPDEWLNEDDVADAVLGERPLPFRGSPRIVSSDVGAGAAECKRLARHRAVMTRGHEPPDPRAVWSAPRHPARSSTQVIGVFSLEHRSANGHLSGEVCCAIHMTLHRTPGTRISWQSFVDRLEAHTALRAAVLRDLTIQASGIERDLADFRAGVGRRVQHIRDRIRRRPAPRVQPSLFDQRVERGAVIRAEAIERLDAALMRRADACAPISEWTPRARLVAVWPIQR